MDGNGILWSANFDGQPLRFDPVTGVGTCLTNIPSTNYGMSIDSQGYIWLARWNDSQIYKLNPSGTTVAGYPKPSGGSTARGVAVDGNDQVWIANSGSNTLVRMNTSGVVLASIPVCSDPIGVAVDKLGKIWVPCQGSNNAVRVNPANNTVDLTVALGAGSGPYTYSDMTGIIALTRTDPQGSWTVIYDSAKAGTPWGTVSWNGDTPSGSSLTVRARSAETPAGLGGASYLPVVSGVDFNPPNGRYLQVEVVFRPGTGAVTPVLKDLTVASDNIVPPCVITNDKTAAPSVVMSGGAATVMLSLRAVGDCSATGSPVDLMLVLDRSGSMSGDKLTKAKAAAVTFVGQMNLAADLVGVASFASTGEGLLNQTLTANATSANAAINGLALGNMTDIREGLLLAANELTSTRHLASHAPVIVLLSDGNHNESAAGELLAAANLVKSKGIRIITIGLGQDVDAAQMRMLASLTTDYYFAPTANDLAAIYQSIVPTVRSAGRNMVLTDTLSSFVSLMPGTFQGPVTPIVVGNQIIWNIPAVPASPITLTYQVAVTSTVGNWPTNDSAVATYTDAAGDPKTLIFPIPHIVVPAVCETPNVTQIEPGWGCVATPQNVAIRGSGFFTQTDWSVITGTFSVNAYIGPHILTRQDYTRDLFRGLLPATSGLAAGVYNVSVVNTCAFTGTSPMNPYTPTQILPINIPVRIYTGTLLNGFTLYPATRLLSVRPPEGYADEPSNITLCGEGFAPDAQVFISTDTGHIPLENQSLYGDTCLAGTVPISLTPGVHIITVGTACGTATGEYRVLATDLNDDLWGQKEDLWISPSLCSTLGETIQVGLQVSRRGGKDPLQNVKVKFYEGAVTGPYIGEGTIPLLSPRVNPSERISGTSTSAVTWVPSQGAGEYTLYAVIDPANVISEDIEINNVVSRTVRILPASLRDGVAPVVTQLFINSWTPLTITTVYTRQIALNLRATDFAPPNGVASGVASLNFVEYLFNSSVSKWVPLRTSGWLTFTPAVTVTRSHAFQLSPVGGLRIIQAWAADAEGKISRYPNWKVVNYAPTCTPISRNGRQVYRQVLQVGDTLRVLVQPCTGDADLYIWPPDWQSGQAAWVSNLPGLAADAFTLASVTKAGEYQVEVYGYTAGTYSIQIEVQSGAASSSRLTPQQVVSSNGTDPDKPLFTEPALPVGSLPLITEGLPPDVPAPDVPILPAGVTINGPTSGQINIAYTFTAVITPTDSTVTLPITYTWMPTPVSGQSTITATYSWLTAGPQTITVTADYAGGAVTDTHAINITLRMVYLPIIMR